MTLRYFDTHPQVVATHIKFVVTNNQCTGQPSYQGDQDNDPNLNSDCRVTATPPVNFPARNTEVHVSEVQVFGQKPTVDAALAKTG
jgi:hypothetical protein